MVQSHPALLKYLFDLSTLQILYCIVNVSRTKQQQQQICHIVYPELVVVIPGLL